MSDACNNLEALDWLQSEASEISGFATNRFHTLLWARVFVRNLYTLGATRVEIAEESIEWEKQPGHDELVPYADAVKVFFEPDSQHGERIFKLCLREISQGVGLTLGNRSLSSEEVVPICSPQGQIELWWD